MALADFHPVAIHVVDFAFAFGGKLVAAHRAIGQVVGFAIVNPAVDDLVGDRWIGERHQAAIAAEGGEAAIIRQLEDLHSEFAGERSPGYRSRAGWCRHREWRPQSSLPDCPRRAVQPGRAPSIRIRPASQTHDP